MTNHRNPSEHYNEAIEKGEMPIDINGWRGRAALEGAWRRLADRLVIDAHNRADTQSKAA